ncbi:MAG: FHA domain-containing protein [Terriglobales bacterium]
MDTNQEELYLPWEYNAYLAAIINQNSRRNANFFSSGNRQYRAVMGRSVRVAPGQLPVNPAIALRQTIGTLTIVDGRTDQQRYILTSKLTLIGRSKMASIRLKRWFSPQVAAAIYQAEDCYVIIASGNKLKIKVNDTVVEGGQKQLEAGDIIEVAHIKAVFST